MALESTARRATDLPGVRRRCAGTATGWAYVREAVLAAALAVALGLAGCSRSHPAAWQTTDITSHLPDLKFALATGGNAHLTADDFRGKTVLLYFGYVHCPDVCPMTLAKLIAVLRDLGDAATDVRILFVSVDPARDSADLVTEYAKAFGPAVTGATGTPAQIEALAKRYRVAYQAEGTDKDGNYEVMHGKAVYVFDPEGRARLLISDTDSPQSIEHDLRQLTASS